MGSTPIPGSRRESSYSSKIFNVVWHLKKQGFSEETIRVTSKLLKGLAKSNGVDLDYPESVKACIARKHCSNGYKENLVNAYDRYVKFHRLFWVKPQYRRIERHPKIPTTQQIDTLINFASRNYRPILTLAKYGLRPIEISMVKRKDIDLAHGLVHVRTAKKGKPRTVKLKPSDLNLVAIYLSMKQYDNEDLVFPNNRAITDNYIKIKKHLAKKHNDPSYLTVRLYDFRHYFATMLYHKTKDILYVKEQLGHKRIENTLVYTHLVNFESDEWLCRLASHGEAEAGRVMSKEQFVAELLILLINRVAVQFRELNVEDYGISRATAYRALKALEEAGLIHIDRGLMLTQTARERLCEPCNYRKKYFKEAQERHRETTRRLHSQI